MLEGFRPVEGTGKVNQAARTEPPARPVADGFQLPPAAGTPVAPPPEVLRALDSVQRVAGELRGLGLDLRFAPGGGGEVSAQVVDADGRVVRELSVLHALEVLSGERALADLNA